MGQVTSSPPSSTDGPLDKKRSRVLNYLVGEVLKREPRANPAMVRAIILGKLGTSS